MEAVTQVLAQSDIHALPQQTELLGRLQHELFQRRALTNWHAPDDAGQCISSARVLVLHLRKFRTQHFTSFWDISLANYLLLSESGMQKTCVE